MKQHLTKSLKAFTTRKTPFGKSQEDTIYFTQAGGPVAFQRETGFVQTEQAYILHLNDAVIVPANCTIGAPNPDLPPPRGTLAA